MAILAILAILGFLEFRDGTTTVGKQWSECIGPEFRDDDGGRPGSVSAHGQSRGRRDVAHARHLRRCGRDADRYGRHLLVRRRRRNSRRGPAGSPSAVRARVEGLHAARTGTARRRAVAQAHHRRVRGQPAASADRLPRSLLGVTSPISSCPSKRACAPSTISSARARSATSAVRTIRRGT